MNNPNSNKACVDERLGIKPIAPRDELADAPRKVEFISVYDLMAALRIDRPSRAIFDIDDTLLCCSEGFREGKRRFGLSNGFFVPDRSFWLDLNCRSDQLCSVRTVGRLLIAAHTKRGDHIEFLTGRPGDGGDHLAAYIGCILNMDGPARIHFAGSSTRKTRLLQDLKADIYYGDSDDDMRQAVEAGAIPVRVLRPRTSATHSITHCGGWGEKILEPDDECAPCSNCICRKFVPADKA